MLKILHKGIQINPDIDPDTLTGDVEVDMDDAYVLSLVGGRMASIDSDGYVQLADGDPAANLPPMGFIINNARGAFLENKPALASRKVPITWGDCVVITDQINTALTFAPGEPLYVDTGGDAGLITNVAPDQDAKVIGIAGSAASLTSPELLIYVG